MDLEVRRRRGDGDQSATVIKTRWTIPLGHIGGAIINVPVGISISITSSNNNMVTENAIVNGGTSYIFYDNRFKTTTGENSGTFYYRFPSYINKLFYIITKVIKSKII